MNDLDDDGWPWPWILAISGVASAWGAAAFNAGSFGRMLMMALAACSGIGAFISWLLNLRRGGEIDGDVVDVLVDVLPDFDDQS